MKKLAFAACVAVVFSFSAAAESLNLTENTEINVEEGGWTVSSDYDLDVTLSLAADGIYATFSKPGALLLIN